MTYNGISGKAPFTFTREMRDTLQEIISDSYTLEQRAVSIFEWMKENIKYDDGRISSKWYETKKNTYQSAHEVYETKKAICLDQAYLYTTFARYAGLQSKIVDVKVDCHGERVCHACSTVKIEGFNILVDPAYKKFDVRHKKYKILTDKEAIEEYNGYDHAYEDVEDGCTEEEIIPVNPISRHKEIIDYTPKPRIEPEPEPVRYTPVQKDLEERTVHYAEQEVHTTRRGSSAGEILLHWAIMGTAGYAIYAIFLEKLFK